MILLVVLTEWALAMTGPKCHFAFANRGHCRGADRLAQQLGQQLEG